jgi:hypothetical protein
VCQGRDLNSRPSDYEPLALPLSYLGVLRLANEDNTMGWDVCQRHIEFALCKRI